jgi:hypothetical protein
MQYRQKNRFLINLDILLAGALGLSACNSDQEKIYCFLLEPEVKN